MFLNPAEMPLMVSWMPRKIIGVLRTVFFQEFDLHVIERIERESSHQNPKSAGKFFILTCLLPHPAF